MFKELRKHPLAYTVLILGLLIGTVFFLAAWPSIFHQRLVVVGLALFYFGWGIATHVKTTELTRQVVIEYAAASVLGMTILLLLTV